MRKVWLALAVWSVLTVEVVQVSADCANIATFNAGLLPHVPEANTRRSLIPAGLSKTNSDVVCLQEVWLESDLEYILNHEDIKDKYAFHYSPIHAGVNNLRPHPRNWWERFQSELRVSSACSYWDRFYFTAVVGSCVVFQGCMEEYQKSGYHGTACMATRCQKVLSSPLLKPGCIQCLFLFSETITATGEECLPRRSVKNNRFNGPGLMLLSKKPLMRARYTPHYDHENVLLARGYLEADVQGIGKVVCTHLTSVFPLFLEYDSDFDNHYDMQTYEVNELIRTFNGQDVVLAGDFNTGPEINQTGVIAEFPDNYQLFVDAGYRNSYVDIPGECTFCLTNEISSGPSNGVIDYILLGGESLTASSPRRIMDDRDYSDHYGVEVNVCHN